MPAPAMLIFLPVRNGGAYLTEAIESILRQTTNDWRLVVLENGSTDDTVARAEHYRDPRIIVRSAGEPLDMQVNWQRAMSFLRAEAEGDPLITFIGHDDLLAADYVETVLALAGNHPAATLYQTHFDVIDGEGRLLYPCRPIPERETVHDLAATLCWGLRDSFGTGYAFRARDHLQVGGWPDLPRLLFSDHLLFLRLTALGYKVASPKTCCLYRRHDGSTSGARGRANLIPYVLALEAFVGTLDAEMPSFIDQTLGRNAMASLLARELSIYRLSAAQALLDPPARAALARLEARLALIDRGLTPARWLRVSDGPVNAARRLVASARLYIATRKS